MASVYDPFKAYMSKLRAANAHLPRADLLRLLRAAEAEHVRWLLAHSS